MGSRVHHSRVEVHARCVEGVLGLGGHVVIGVVLGFQHADAIPLMVTLSLVSCSVSPRKRNTKCRVLSFWIL